MKIINPISRNLKQIDDLNLPQNIKNKIITPNSGVEFISEAGYYFSVLLFPEYKGDQHQQYQVFNKGGFGFNRDTIAKTTTVFELSREIGISCKESKENDQQQ